MNNKLQRFKNLGYELSLSQSSQIKGGINKNEIVIAAKSFCSTSAAVGTVTGAFIGFSIGLGAGELDVEKKLEMIGLISSIGATIGAICSYSKKAS